MAIPNVTPYSGQKPVPGQDQPTFNQNMSDELDYFNALPAELNPAINAMNQTATDVDNAKTAAETAASEAATSATAAAASGNYQGEFIVGTTSALLGESYLYNGKIWLCLANTTSTPDVTNSAWKNRFDVLNAIAVSNNVGVDSVAFLAVSLVYSDVNYLYEYSTQTIYYSPVEITGTISGIGTDVDGVRTITVDATPYEIRSLSINAQEKFADVYEMVDSTTFVGGKYLVHGTTWLKNSSSNGNLFDFKPLGDINISGFNVNQFSDSSSDINLAISVAGICNGAKINLNGLELYTPTISNPNGVELYNGACVVDNTTGVLQKNSYADKERHFGYEYLFRINRSIEEFRAQQPNWFVYGDSTVEGGYGEYRKPSEILNELMSVKGIPNVSVTNRGVSGTRIGDLDAIGDLGAGTSAIFIKYGINDADLPLDTFRDTLDLKLSAIRAAAYGSMSELSIVLVGPNTTNEPTTGKTSLWYEKLRGIYEWAARKHQCFYFDTYSVLQDAQNAATVWLDNQNGDGRGVHPINNANYWIWGRLLDEILPDSSIYNYATNVTRNTLGAYDVANVHTVPASYPYGKIVQQALAANGFPFDGLLITDKGADGIVYQKLVTIEQRPLSVSRNGNSGASFGSWTGHRGGIELQNNWRNKTGYLPASFCMSEGGMVTLSGTIENGTTGGGIVIGNIPFGFRPVSGLVFPVAIQGGVANVFIGTDGNITEFGASASATSLDGISFPTF
jgi:hypothetical protein